MKTDLNFVSNHGVTSPFILGREQRCFRAFIDREHLVEGKATQLLEEFASHGELEVVTTHKDGQERIVFGERRDHTLQATVITDTGTIGTGVRFVDQWYDFARQPILRDGLTLPPGPWIDEGYRLRQYLLAKVAEALTADLFITDDLFLLNFSRPGFLRLNFVPSTDALALIGSYLRRRDDFVVRRSDFFTNSLGRGLFYWVLCRELLPNGWRWFSAIVKSDSEIRGHLTNLGQSVLMRVEQALKARDNVHWQLLQPHNNDTADDALFYLDMILLALSAAFGVVARVADRALGLACPSRHISWNNDSWRRRLRKEYPSLDAAMARNAEHGQTHRLLSLLRNSIHGEALRTMAYETPRKPLEHLLILPHSDRDDLSYLIGQMGGTGLWGYEDLSGLFACVKPGMLTEQLVPRAIAALNDLMGLTPVERLPGLGMNAPLSDGPPVDDDVWSKETRSRLRLLSGF